MSRGFRSHPEEWKKRRSGSSESCLLDRTTESRRYRDGLQVLVVELTEVSVPLVVERPFSKRTTCHSGPDGGFKRKGDREVLTDRSMEGIG